MSAEERRAFAIPPAEGPGPARGVLDVEDESDRQVLLAAAHPELRDALEAGLEEIDLGQGPMSPGLHLALHGVVAGMILDDDPPVLWRTARRLTGLGYEQHQILHMLAAVVGPQLTRMLAREVPFDARRLAEGLAELPDSWHDDEEDEDDGGHDPQAAREEVESLLARFARWGEVRQEDVGAARLLLMHQILIEEPPARWTVDDLEHVLLEVLPREVVLLEEHIDQIVPSLRRFLDFMSSARLLAPDSDRPAELHAALLRLRGPFAARMRDPSLRGPITALVAEMAEQGVDLDDAGAVAAFMDELNARPFEERGEALGLPELQQTPVLEAPSPDRLAELAGEATALRWVLALLEWLGDEPRPLTQRGNLRLADGKALVEVLGTDDVVDEQIGERTFRTTSSTELRGVEVTHQLALRARLTRKSKGRMHRTRRGAAAAADPVGTWEAITDALLELGLYSAGFGDRYGLGWIGRTLEPSARDMVASLYGGPVPLAHLVHVGERLLREAYDIEGLPDHWRDDFTKHVGWAVERMVHRLEWLGALRWEGRVVRGDAIDRAQLPYVPEGEVDLTPLGNLVARAALLEDGYAVPLLGALDDADAGELLLEVGGWPPEAAKEQTRRWVARREDAVSELVAALRESDDPRVRMMTMEALDQTGAEGVAAVRELQADPRLRPLATLWLTGHGHLAQDALDPADVARLTVEQLASVMLGAGPTQVVEMLAELGSPSEQAEMIEALGVVDDPHTDGVLEALTTSGELAVSKAARKALLRARSSRS